MPNDDQRVIFSMVQVSKTHGQKAVLRDISLGFFYGAKIGVIGLNGSGKSSLVRAVLGLVPLAAGRVVYAGSGLIGYGQLIIIKHNDTYLSAYGYNASLLVKEGEVVKKGQRIATMGEGPERKARLHFEIRRNGEPVDPRRYLPAK